MPTLRLERPRVETLRLIEAVLAEMPAVAEYAVDDDVVTAEVRGGFASAGSTLVVQIDPERSGPAETVFTVAASRRFGLNLTANPYKHQSEFVERVHGFRDTPADALPEPPSATPAEEPELTAEDFPEGDELGERLAEEERAEPAGAAVPMAAARLFFWMLVGLLAIVAVAVAIQLLL